MTGLSAELRLSMPVAAGPGFALDVALTVPDRGITAVFGESGSGKTTLLRCLAGLERAAEGRIALGETLWQGEGVFVPTHRRRVGYVFQESSLLPHLSVQANLRFGERRIREARESEFARIVDLLGIGELLQSFPQQLSGGERQRVAIARSLLQQPRLLLMDEPLAALDLARKQEILPYLEALPQQFDLPIVYVTHSLDEVTRLADYLLVLKAGRLIASGEPESVLSDLALPQRLQLGDEAGTVLTARVLERDRDWHLLRLEFPGGELWVRDSGHEPSQTIRLRILARDVSLALSSHQDSSIVNRLPATVVDMGEDGDPAMQLVKLALGESHLVARISRRSAHQLALESGKSVWAQIKSVAILH